jgi:hypothetical protein
MEHAIAVAFGSIQVKPASCAAAPSPDHTRNQSGNIVTFPRPFASPTHDHSGSLDPLLKSTERLHAVTLVEQAAIAAWRGSLNDAAHALETLETSMLSYERRLASLDLSGIAAKSLTLAEIMDKAIVAKG